MCSLLSLPCQIERRLDTVRSVCHHSHKRLVACFQGQHGTDAEKRHVSIRCDSDPEFLRLSEAFQPRDWLVVLSGISGLAFGDFYHQARS